MKLRSELEPKIGVAEKLFPQVIDLISKYDNACDEGDVKRIEMTIHQINELTNKGINEDDLFEYWGAQDIEDVAFKLSVPSPLKVENFTKAELLEIIRRIRLTFSEKYIENVIECSIPAIYFIHISDYYFSLIDKNFAYPKSSSNIFSYKEANGKFIELSDEEIAQKILSYKPIMI
jgi:hypothetical protein